MPEAEGIVFVKGEPWLAGTDFRLREVEGFEVPDPEDTAIWIAQSYPELTLDQARLAVAYFDAHKWDILAAAPDYPRRRSRMGTIFRAARRAVDRADSRVFDLVYPLMAFAAWWLHLGTAWLVRVAYLTVVAVSVIVITIERDYWAALPAVAATGIVLAPRPLWPNWPILRLLMLASVTIGVALWLVEVATGANLYVKDGLRAVGGYAFVLLYYLLAAPVATYTEKAEGA